MKVLYRPNRRMLDEAMAEVKEFDSLREMLVYVAKKDWYQDKTSIHDVCIIYYGYDERIDWDTYIVCDCSEGNCKRHGAPQVLGFCTFKE